jgi:hypothetical protein
MLELLGNCQGEALDAGMGFLGGLRPGGSLAHSYKPAAV